MEKIKELYHKYKQLIPVLILLVYSIDLWFAISSQTFESDGNIYWFKPGFEHYAALSAIVLNVIVFFLVRRYFKYVFIATLAATLLGWLGFQTDERIVRLGLFGLHIEFHTQVFWPAIAVFIINFKRIFADGKTTGDFSLAAETREEDIVKFRSAFELYTTEDLHAVMADKRYTSAAVEAARQLLEEKGKG